MLPAACVAACRNRIQNQNGYAGESSLSRRRQVVAQCAAASDRAPLFAIAIGWSVYHAALTTTAVAGLGEIVRLQRLALLRVVTTCSQFGRIGSVARLGWAV